MREEPVKPLKLCRVCGKNYCLSGYCSFCRDKDATARTIAAREVMDRKPVITNTVSAEPSGTTAVFPAKNVFEGFMGVTIVTDTCPNCGSLILKATVEQKEGGEQI
jgi:hypothetical protein